LTKLLVIIAGPTASGKTRLAIDLALHFKTEIISADSRQFYKELSIGTAKPSEAELREVPHHFINSHSVTENVTAGTYEKEVHKLLDTLFQKNDVVIMAGGSGLYIEAVINGIDELPERNAEIRTGLDELYKSGGLPALQEKMKSLDPEGYTMIDVNNPRRLIRALEITLASSTPYSSLLGKKVKQHSWEWLMAGIDWPRAELYKRINERTAEMIRAGLKTEVEEVITHRDMNSLSTVGYKEMFDHIDGKTTLEEATELIAQHTRNYAKRQLTWFRRYSEMIWMQPGDEMKLVKIIQETISSNE